MIRIILAIIYTIVLAPVAQSSSACVTSSADVAASWASATTCLYIPAGDYQITPGTLQSSAQGFTVYGDGMGLTRLHLPDNEVVSAPAAAIKLTGSDQTVRDLSITGGANPSGASVRYGVSISQGATGTHIQRVEVSAIYGGTSAGGSGIDLYQPWNVNGGRQNAMIEDCYLHDGPSMTGLIVNSNGNTIRNNRIERTGTLLTQHGVYVQGGYNLIDGNTILNVGGYSLHAWQKVQSIDGSGNIYRANVSIDPGFQHMIVSGLVSNGTNPAIPNGQQLTRFVTIQGNLFRNTAQRLAAGINSDVPALISDNTFEDVVKNGAAVIQVNPLALGSIIRGNAIRAFQPATTNGTAINPGASLVEGNTIDLRGLSNAIGLQSPGAIIGANTIYRSL